MNLQRRLLAKVMDYVTYRKLLDRLLLEGKTTGPNQSASFTEHARLNVVRMK